MCRERWDGCCAAADCASRRAVLPPSPSTHRADRASCALHAHPPDARSPSRLRPREPLTPTAPARRRATRCRCVALPSGASMRGRRWQHALGASTSHPSPTPPAHHARSTSSDASTTPATNPAGQVHRHCHPAVLQRPAGRGRGVRRQRPARGLRAAAGVRGCLVTRIVQGAPGTARSLARGALPAQGCTPRSVPNRPSNCLDSRFPCTPPCHCGSGFPWLATRRVRSIPVSRPHLALPRLSQHPLD